jgi:hypothetical protein
MYKSVHGIIAIMLVLAAVMAAVAILSERAGQRRVSNDQAPAGSSGIARPHPPLDRAPGEPLKTPL